MDYSRELASIYAISFIVSLHLVLQSSVQTFDVMGLSARQADEAVPGLHLQPIVRLFYWTYGGFDRHRRPACSTGFVMCASVPRNFAESLAPVPL